MSKNAWSDRIVESSATRALESSIEQNRLGHGLLFVADDFLAADAAAESAASMLLKSD